MKKVKIKTLLLFVTAITVFAGCTLKAGQERPVESENDRAAITGLINRYVETINRCDTALVNQIWSHDTDVSFIDPTGYYSTYNEIRDSLVVGILGRLFKERHLQSDNLKIDIDGNMAWSEFTWSFDAVRIDGTAHHAKGQETQIFKRYSDGKWRLVHIHYSAIE